MKVTDNTSMTPTFFMTSLRKNTPIKPFKFNRRLKNRMASLSKNLSTTAPRNQNCQTIPVPARWTTAPQIPQTPMVTFIGTNPTPMNTFSSSGILPSLIDKQQSQKPPIYPSYKPFTTPHLTTTLIPLNACHTEYCQTVKPSPTFSTNVVDNHREQNIFEHKSKSTVTTHLIGDWIIRESSEPFQRNENQRSTPIKQLATMEEKRVITDESINLSQSLPSNVKRWTTDDVCLFFERVLGKKSYSSIINEHIIDGAALVLLEDEHLISIFKMQLGPRLKLLNCINKLKNGEDASV